MFHEDVVGVLVSMVLHVLEMEGLIQRWYYLCLIQFELRGCCIEMWCMVR